MKRQALTKKTRFEVFKRDSFKCQYCGESAPDVILHVDHINPVASGGDNVITNLITSCLICNLGKGARKLSDSSAVLKQKKQLDDLNERRQQLEMMMEWRSHLLDLDQSKLDLVHEHYRKHVPGYRLSETGLNNFRKLLKKYSIELVLDAIEISASQYLVFDKDEQLTKDSVEKTFNYVSRICAVKTKQADNPTESELYYIRGILKNRFSTWYNTLNYQTLDWMKHAVNQGVEIDDLKDIAKQATNWTSFRMLINEAIEGLSDG